MLRRHLIGAALAGALLAAPAAAFAETAEEAVAYTLMGLADGAHLERGTTVMDWREVSAVPAVFAGDAVIGGKQMRIAFTVSAADPCHYEVALEGPMVPAGGKTLYARLDLTALSGLRISEDALGVEVAGDALCETGRTNADCMRIDRSDLFGAVDPDRHAALLDFILAEVCPPEEKPR